MNLSNVFNFLGKLKQNNNREWFQEHKAQYIAAMDAFKEFLNALIPPLQKIDPELGIIQVKDCIFRIYRDVRFAKDKSPYKTNFGAFMAKGGRRGGYAGYYLHLEPGSSFLGGGIYMPAAQNLKAVRSEIYFHAPEFKKIMDAPDFKKLFGEIQGARLSRPPKDFPKDFGDIDLLKFKDYYVSHQVSDQIVGKEDFLNYALDVFRAMLPLNRFINRAVESIES